MAPALYFSFLSAGSQPIFSSTPLQVLLYLNSWYFAAFYLAEILMMVYKGILLPYPSDNLVLDVVLLLLFLALETVRIFYALAVYYLLLQTFVLRFEVLLNTILICFYILEFLLGLLSISAFSRS
uniref:transmembrane protein 216 isoform X6 n=1 Tax=Scatophagus argus TaxID=75038 RepID=UPI001ED7F551|nr:transmembrane protein 216 isoform X6 [Scatophagus argus]